MERPNAQFDLRDFVRVLHSLSAPASLREELLVRDSAFAPEAWVRSAIHPYPGPFDSRGFAPFAGRSNGRGLPLLQGRICFPYPPQRPPWDKPGTQLRRWPFE